jgi:hypothetical protein
MWKNWNIRKLVKCGKYLFAVVPEHPYKYAHNYVLAHRVIMENYLKRLLDVDEIVHHKNTNKFDNRIENLQVLTRRQHSKQHRQDSGRKMVQLKCPCCNKIFLKEHRLTHLCQGGRCSCCSRSCGSKFGRKIVLEGLTRQIRRAIKENVIKEYRRYL